VLGKWRNNVSSKTENSDVALFTTLQEGLEFVFQLVHGDLLADHPDLVML
jgi:hypothetical protein